MRDCQPPNSRWRVLARTDAEPKSVGGNPWIDYRWSASLGRSGSEPVKPRNLPPA
jgi:hypothetical protein